MASLESAHSNAVGQDMNNFINDGMRETWSKHYPHRVVYSADNVDETLLAKIRSDSGVSNVECISTDGLEGPNYMAPLHGRSQCWTGRVRVLLFEGISLETHSFAIGRKGSIDGMEREWDLVYPDIVTYRAKDVDEHALGKIRADRNVESVDCVYSYYLDRPMDENEEDIGAEVTYFSFT
ncbi:hypothetical protein K402DRAFT_391687 [Aulographum hederae CBS 113979]|uniref:Uncharacterized protein n=1 Tax=Aulographum hederae CBS 113979 TaxID=1176131 RepID=A0A6G1H5M3_9PEZI|nr:hypothetical protein K402DRAFT_391687 [Aulographum hederae CBS 113979]